VITVPEMNVSARAGDTAGRIRTEHTRIREKEKNNLFMAISNLKSPIINSTKSHSPDNILAV
jgi:hypothetical protein